LYQAVQLYKPTRQGTCSTSSPLRSTTHYTGADVIDGCPTLITFNQSQSTAAATGTAAAKLALICCCSPMLGASQPLPRGGSSLLCFMHCDAFLAQISSALTFSVCHYGGRYLLPVSHQRLCHPVIVTRLCSLLIGSAIAFVGFTISPSSKRIFFPSTCLLILISSNTSSSVSDRPHLQLAAAQLCS
jgi:hypothetical protein